MKKEDLRIGNWYSNRRWLQGTFAKLHDYRQGTFMYSESVGTLGHSWAHGGWSLWENDYSEMTDSEKISFLPKDHPDYPYTSKVITETISIKDACVGDRIIILEEPDKWNSALGGNSPLRLSYPFECTIEKISLEKTCFNASGYGFSSSTKFIKNMSEDRLINDFPVF
jgi:hypothetical protein